MSTKSYTSNETAPRGSASRKASSNPTSLRGTTSRGTAQTGTVSRGTASRGTAPRVTAPRGTTSRGTASRGASQPGVVRRTSSGYTTSRHKSSKRHTVHVAAFARNWILAFFEAAIIVFILFIFLWPVKVNGISMEPSVRGKDRVLISRVMAMFGFIDCGDIVVCNLPGEGDETVSAVRRVIGLPGDIVTISGGIVAVNGEILDERYLGTDSLLGWDGTYPDMTVYLQADQYFIMGDNRLYSGDSRTFGPIKSDDIKAKVVFRLYPLSALKFY